MKLFTRAKTPSLSAKANAADSTIHFVRLDQISGLNGYIFGEGDILKDAYLGNPYVFMVVDRLASRFSTLPVYAVDDRGKEVTDDVFIDFVKSEQERQGLLYRLASSLLTVGETYLFRLVKPPGNVYVCPPPGTVSFKSDLNRTEIWSFGLSMGSEIKTFLPSDVLYINNPDITRYTLHGLSPLKPAHKSWQANNETWAAQAALHKHKGVAGAIYGKGERPMEAKEQKNLQEQFDKQYAGNEGFGKVMISTSELGYLRMGMNANDLKLGETSLNHLRAICAGYNVDSKLFGDPSASTYNNMAEAKASFIADAVLPLANRILPALGKFLSGHEVGQTYTLKVREGGIPELQITKAKESERIRNEVAQGILTVEEARAILYPQLGKKEEQKNP